MDVHHLTADADVFTCNVFLVPGEQTTLIDAGSMNGIVDAVLDHVDSLDRVVLTHQHGDHVEQLEAVVEAFNPECFAYAAHPHRTHSLEDSDKVVIGSTEFESVHTPGHAPDHLAFVGTETLFSGDVVVHDDGAFEGGSFGRTDGPDQSRERLIESIEALLARLPPTIEHMYSGHGGVYHGDVHAVVERALERAKRREPKYPEE